MAGQTVLAAGIAALLLWRAVRRFRKLVGPQPLSEKRLHIRSAIFLILVALLAVVGAAYGDAGLGLLSGILLGSALGYVSYRGTTFSVRGRWRFYTPKAYLGATVAIVFLIRIVYRIARMALGASAAPSVAVVSGLDGALTFAAFGLLAGYQLTHAQLVLHRNRTFPPLSDGHQSDDQLASESPYGDAAKDVL